MQGTSTRTVYVYLFQLDDLYKIGVSWNPQARLAQVRRGALVARVVHAISSAKPYQIENALHRRFSALHVKDERFRLTPEDVGAICAVSRVNSLGDLPVELRPTTTEPFNRSRLVRTKRIPLYVEIPASLRSRLNLVREANGRTLSREVERALRSYLDAEDKRIKEEQSDSSDN